MAIIDGTTGNDLLDGTATADTINGLAGNDTINGLEGDDILDGGAGNDLISGGIGNDQLLNGGGIDALLGGDGDDLLILNAATLAGGIYDGGAGFDTIVARMYGSAARVPHYLQNANSQAVVSVERVRFESLAGGRQLEVSILAEQFAGSGITELVGGPGLDAFYFLLTTTTPFTVPNLTLTGWSSTNDSIVVQVAPGVTGGVTLTARDNYATRQFLQGGVGDDTINGSNGNDYLYGGGGRDNLFGGDGQDTLYANGSALAGGIYDGGGSVDTLVAQTYGTGTSNHFIYDLSGNAYQTGGFANIERIQFESASATVLNVSILYDDLGNSGLGELIGGAGTDQMFFLVTSAGSFEMPRLNLTNWNPTATFTATEDRLVLQVAPSVVGDVSLSAIDNYATTQILEAENGNDTLIGANGKDLLFGGAGNDTMFGNAGDDQLSGEGGIDLLYGGLGNDTYVVDDAADLTFENAGEGTDTVVAWASVYLYAEIENLSLAPAAGAGFGVGNELANLINGNSSDNTLIGYGGDDRISGASGRDLIFGVDGNDQILGGNGIDYIAAGIGNDTADGGSDPDEIYGEEGDDTLTGGAGFFTDILVGGSGNDVLRGDSGSLDYDLLYGGEGDDTYYVDTGDDLTFESAGGGTDTVIATLSLNNQGVYLYAEVENLELNGGNASIPGWSSGFIHFGVGNGLDNVLLGTLLNGDTLLGGAGDDTLNGRGGNDILFGEGGADTFVFEAGTGGDVIGDFQAGTDKLNLVGYGLDFAGVSTLFVQVGNVGAIQFANGDVIVLHSVQMNQLTAGDFIFG